MSLLGDPNKTDVPGWLIFTTEQDPVMAALMAAMDRERVSRYNSGGGSLNPYGRLLNYIQGAKHWFGDESEEAMRLQAISLARINHKETHADRDREEAVPQDPERVPGRLSH